MYSSRISDNMNAVTLTADMEAESVRLAAVKMSQWNLLTHAGFVTYPHKDANGVCTWIYAHQGVKVWGILRPTYTSEHNSKEDLFKVHEAMIKPPGDFSWGDQSQMYTIFLAAGDLLYVSLSFNSLLKSWHQGLSIMPPGTWHVVYTATPSYVSGGHFYTYETLHLTEFSRSFDHLPDGEFATNANNNVLWVLCRMAMALHMLQGTHGTLIRHPSHPFSNWNGPFIELYKKPLVALAKMILDHEHYDPAGYPVPTIEGTELRDLQLSKGIMRNFLEAISKADPNAVQLQYGKDWALIGETLDRKIKVKKYKKPQ